MIYIDLNFSILINLVWCVLWCILVCRFAWFNSPKVHFLRIL